MTNLNLIDIGANLTHESFQHDLDDVLQRAQNAGINKLIVTGASEEGSQQALSLTKQYPEKLYATAGIHPHYAKDFSPTTINVLKNIAQDKKTVAIGETGLDFFRHFSTPKQQEYSFEQHIELAIELDMPLFLHQREAHDRFIEILQYYRKQITRAVVHCFTGDKHELYDYLDLDLYIGITGWICDERRGHHLHEFANEIPLDKLMIETDAPYLLPRNLNPKPSSRRNEPYYLIEVLKMLSSCTGISTLELAQTTYEVTNKFFNLPNIKL